MIHKTTNSLYVGAHVFKIYALKHAKELYFNTILMNAN